MCADINFYAVSTSGWRAIASPDDLVEGETLHTGAQPERSEVNNELIRAQLMSAAASVIAPLQDAVDLDMATADEAASLLAWKKYRVLLNRVDVLLAPDIAWPEQP